LRRNRRSVAIGLNLIFAVLPYGGRPISVLVSSSPCIRQDVSSISVLTGNGNGTTERDNGTTERQNGTAKRQRGRMATEWWKPGITLSTEAYIFRTKNDCKV